MPLNILIIDDEAYNIRSLSELLKMEGYHTDSALNGAEGIKKIDENTYDCILCDYKMAGKDGMEVLEYAVKEKPETPFVMMSGHGNIQTAVEAIKKGAYNYLEKPLDMNRLFVTLKNATEKKNLTTEAKQLKKQLSKGSAIVGESEAILEVMRDIDKVAPIDARVLITGENGVGKELVARRIHELSNRRQKTIIEVNCAAIPAELIESELFGHEKGAFTGADKQYIGKFEQAHGSTLFLDEIGDMSLNAQAKMLRALQENKITRVGGTKDIAVDVRIIAATNKNLQAEAAAQRFRLDLYHRLSVVPIKVPSLNDRRSDIPLLALHFLTKIASDLKQPDKQLAPEALTMLQNKNWGGNIRELRNAIERLIILADNATISAKDVEKYVLSLD